MFKRLITASIISLACAAALAQTAACPSIEVTGLQANTGTVQLAIYGSADQFFKKPVFATRVEVKADSISIPVCGVEAQEIAVTGFQDLNGNNKMDSNALGIPTEPYGASGKPPRFSAPTWDTTKVAWPPANGASVLVKF